MTRGPKQSAKTELILLAVKEESAGNIVSHGAYSKIAERFGVTRQWVKTVAERNGYSQRGAA